jgi:aldose 1-epimerase
MRQSWSERRELGRLSSISATTGKLGLPDVNLMAVMLKWVTSYFNLSGSATIENTVVELSTNRYLPVDDTSIPLGTIDLYPGITANSTFTLGASEPDIDHCFIMNSTPSTVPIDTRALPLCKLAAFFHPDSRIHLEVHSTEPAFQFYTGKYIDVPAVGGLAARGARSGFCVEPSRYVNAVNVEGWRDMAVLKRGEKYGSRILYRGWQEKE